MFADALPPLNKRLDDMPDAAAREGYLTKVATNARLLARALEWLRLDARA